MSTNPLNVISIMKSEGSFPLQSLEVKGMLHFNNKFALKCVKYTSKPKHILSIQPLFCMTNLVPWPMGLFLLMVWNVWATIRDVKTYQRANNVGVKNHILGKFFAKSYTLLSRKLVMSPFPFFMAFFDTFWNFMYIFGIFLHYFGCLGLLHCFVAS